VNYSLLIMVTAKLMKMAGVMILSSGRVLERGPDWFFMATEAYDGRTSHLGFFLGFWYL